MSNELLAAVESEVRPIAPQQLKGYYPFILLNYKLLSANSADNI